MTVALRSLRVDAQMNASQYVAGMNEKVAADNAGVASSLRVGAIIQQTDTKIRVASDGIEVLRRRFVEGHSQTREFEKALVTLGRAVERDSTVLQDADAILTGLYRKYGITADAAALTEKGQHALAAAVSSVNDRIREQEKATDSAVIAQRELAESYARSAAAARAEQAAATVQGQYAKMLGIGTAPQGGARASAAVFEQELSRLEEVATQRAQQAGQAFGDALNARLIPGIQKSARESASVFEAEFARLDDIARLRAQQTGQAFAADLDARMGVGRSGGSARDSAAVFEAADREAEQYAAQAKNLRALLDPVAAAQDRLNVELAEYAALAERGAISSTELAGAQKLAQVRYEATVDGLDAVAKASKNAANQQRVLVFQLNDVFQSLALGMPVTQVALQQGPQIAQIWGPDEGGIGRAFRETGKLITGVIAKFPLLSGATVAAAAAFAGLTYEINQSTKASVGFGDVALASVQVLWRYLSDFLKPAIGSIGGWFQAAWDGVIAGVKFTGNLIINSFRAAFEDIKLLWNQLPNTIGAAAVGAANALIGAVQFMVQKAAEHLDKLIEGANVALSKIPGGDFTISPIGKLDFGDSNLPNKYADELKKAVDQRGEKIKEIMGSDPLGGFYKDVREQAIKNALADEKKKGGKSARESDYERTIRRIKERTEATEQDTKVVGLSTFAIERQAAVQDILTAAQRDGLAIGKAFANAQDLIKASSENLSPKLASERDRILGVATAYANAEAAAEKAEEARRKFEDNMRFARDTARGFIDDFTGAIEEGASVWDAFARAALSALDRIVDKLLDDVMDAIFDVKKAGSGSSGGILGWFGGLFGGGGSADPWAGLRTVNAKGGVYGAQGVTAFAKGGAFTNQIVDRPTLFPFAKGAGLMGEAGPEAIMPLRRDGSGRLGVSAAMGRMFSPANQNRPMRFEFHSKITVAGNGDKELMERLHLATEQQMQAGFDEFSRVVLPGRVSEINNDPYAVG